MLVFYCGVTRGHLSRGVARTAPAEPPPLGSSSAPTPPTNYDLSLLTRRPRAVLLAPASSRSLAAGGSHHHAGRPARDAALASSRETHRLLRGSARAERGRRSTHSLGRSPWSLHGGAGEQSITLRRTANANCPRSRINVTPTTIPFFLTLTLALNLTFELRPCSTFSPQQAVVTTHIPAKIDVKGQSSSRLDS